ncbi:MAG: hypothetical protein COA67_08165 [Lutibacter sp.]|nr:MAG: hypothetical protein COA67_08165 [Lutibacter sp.]
MKYIVKIVALLLLFPSMMMANNMDGKYTKTKTIKKEFNVNDDAQLYLNNKYGNIDIKTWNQNVVSIEVIITTNGNSESKVEERLENIDVYFENSSQEVSAKTHFEKQNNSWSFFGKRSSVNIDVKYIVRMPISNNLNVNMDYGDVVIDELEGEVSLNCDYGKIYVGKLLNDKNYINLDYSRGSTIDYMKNGEINIDYTTLDIEEAGNIDLNTDYSNTTFGKVNNLEFNSDYGNLIVHSANKIVGNSDYVSLKFGEINNTLIVEADYGSIKVEKMGVNFDEVNLNTEYTGVKIGVDSNSSFSLVADSQYSGISVPEDFNFTKQIEKNSKKHYEGTYNGTNGKITIKSQYGGIKIYKN